MSCISSQMNSLTGYGFEPRSTSRVVQGSMEHSVRFLKMGRSNLVRRVRYTFRLRNRAQVA